MEGMQLTPGYKLYLSQNHDGVATCNLQEAAASLSFKLVATY
jgi:hypothetical protein